jgi:hypothetical protein
MPLSLSWTKEVCPAFDARFFILGIGFVFVDTFFRAKLLKGKPPTNQPEASITLMATLYAESRVSGQFGKAFCHLYQCWLSRACAIAAAP